MTGAGQKMKNTKLISLLTAAAVISASAGLMTASAYAQEEPPALPDGEAPGGGMGTPPDKPDGEAPGGEMGTPPDKPDGEAPGGMGGAPGGSSSGVSEYTAVTEYSSDTSTSGQTYTSTGTDENAVLVSGGNVLLEDATVSRTSSDSTGGDNSSFYGVGAAVLATDGTVYIDGGEINTDSKGGAGAFAYGSGTVYIRDTQITTKQSTSGGIHAAGGGTVYAWDLDVETNGESSAAVRSDRGGGTMVVDGGTYTSNGTGSPAVYCTADITVNAAELNATGSEGICIEGLNSLYIYDSDLTADMPVTAQNENMTWTVIVYQSMSGDAEVGNSEFYYEGGSIDTTSDILIYTTNTESHITLNDVSISSDSDDLVILRATGNANGRGWGSTGNNGADCTFTAIAQELNGNIVYDSISDLEFYLTDGSILTGAVIDDESDAGSGGSSPANIYIDSTSVWIVTADSTCTNLYNAGSVVDEDGNTVTVKDASGNTLVEGSSTVTVTVSGTYSETADMSGATTDSDFTAVSLPVQFTGDAETVSDTEAEATAEETSDTAATVTADDEGNPKTGTVTAISAFIAAIGAAVAARRKK